MAGPTAMSLVEAVPPRLRFSSASGAPAARSILLRNISLGEVPLRLEFPGAPFKLVHGGERLSEGVVRLQPGETLPLRVAWDRSGLKAGEELVCKFMVLRVDMCLPSPVDFVVAPDDMTKEDVQRFVQTSLPPELVRRSFAMTAGAAAASASAARSAPSQGAQQGHSGDGGEGTAGVESGGEDPAADAAGAGAVSKDQARAVLAAFLGEAPADAAMRQAQPGGPPASGRADMSRRRRGAARGGDDDESDDERLGGAAPVAFRGRGEDDDDDRPPTPTPEGFECRPRAVPVARRGAAAMDSSFQEPGSPIAGATDRAAALTTASDPASPGVPSASHHVDGAFGWTAADDEAAAIAALTELLGEAPTKAALRRPQDGDEDPDDLGAAGLDESMAAGLQPPPPPGVDVEAEGLFFVDGVGWCDAYGQVYGGSGSASGATGAAGSTSAGSAAGSASRGAKSSTKTASVASRTGPDRARGGGASRGAAGGRGARTVQPPQPKLTKAEIDANWEALGGI